MTEVEWMSCEDPARMLTFVQGKASGRKLRLFAVACCRQVWELLTDVRGRRAVEAAERFADGQISSEELAQAWEAALQAANNAFVSDDRVVSIPLWVAFSAPEKAAESVCHYVLQVEKARQSGDPFDPLFPGTRTNDKPPLPRRQVRLLRDLFGNPFRPPSFPASWLAWNDGTLVKLAAAIYEERRFGDLPVLADALEEAGCDHPEVLAHCRGGGEHVRGCWVVDQILLRP